MDEKTYYKFAECLRDHCLHKKCGEKCKYFDLCREIGVMPCDWDGYYIKTIVLALKIWNNEPF